MRLKDISGKSVDLPVPLETQEQQAVVRWWSMQHRVFNLPEIALMASPAQAARSKRNGARMKAEGYRTGTPDLFLAVPRKGKHGLFIEMKRLRGGALSDEQAGMLAALAEQDYAAFMCRGALLAIETIKAYLA